MVIHAADVAGRSGNPSLGQERTDAAHALRRPGRSAGQVLACIPARAAVPGHGRDDPPLATPPHLWRPQRGWTNDHTCIPADRKGLRFAGSYAGSTRRPRCNAAQGAGSRGRGTADPQRRLPAHASQLITSQGHDWLASKAFLTAVRLTYRLCDSREPVKRHRPELFVLVSMGVVGLRGLEPRTSSLSGKRSNRLSYRPRGAGDQMIPARTRRAASST